MKRGNWKSRKAKKRDLARCHKTFAASAPMSQVAPSGLGNLAGLDMGLISAMAGMMAMRSARKK